MKKPKGKLPGFINPGQDLVIAGSIALEGTSCLAKEKEEELLKYYSRCFLRSAEQLKNQMVSGELFKNKEELKISAVLPVNEGGIMTALWHLAEDFEIGITIDLKAIPIHQETIEICEVFNLNPYRLRSGGSFLLTADHGGDLVSKLAERGILAVVAGKITSGVKKLIFNGDNCSFLDRPGKEELLKIL